jgi:hypothetical protein
MASFPDQAVVSYLTPPLLRRPNLIYAQSFKKVTLSVYISSTISVVEASKECCLAS